MLRKVLGLSSCREFCVDVLCITLFSFVDGSSREKERAMPAFFSFMYKKTLKYHDSLLHFFLFFGIMYSLICKMIERGKEDARKEKGRSLDL